MKYPKLTLKPGKEKSVAYNRHPWIFSGAIDQMPNVEKGSLVDVYSSSGTFLARAYLNPDNSIAARVISFTEQNIESLFEEKFAKALSLRQSVISSNTNCYRLINSESDGLPGLIVDRYNDILVMQIQTAGMDKLRPLVIKALCNLIKPRSIYEKSLSSARSLEGLDPFQGFLMGEEVDEVLVEENGIQFFVSIVEGQKTGLFLDHREMRKWIYQVAKGKRVLNCFSYTGGFSLYALAAGASSVTSVDISESACRYAQKNTHINQIPSDLHTVVCEDVFEFLSKETLDYDIVIIDPPAFAKKRKDIDSATIGYRKLNTLVLSKVRKGTIVLTSSCSHFIDKQMFQHIVFQAGAESGRDIKILQYHILAADHPLSLYHPEGEYLKSLILYVD